MNIYIGVTIGVVIVLLLIYAFVNYRKLGGNFSKGLNADGLEPIIVQLEADADPDPSILLQLAENVATRQNLFHILKSYHKLNLFPDDYNNISSGAESNLVNWIAVEENLLQPPTQISLVEQIKLKEKNNTLTYYVFKFKIDPPHFSADKGWLLGVVGPYSKKSKPFDWPKVVFII